MKRKIYYVTLLLIVLLIGTACSKKEEKKLKSEDKKEEVKLEAKYDWAEETVFYEIFVRSFYDSNGDGIGDFNGVAQKVDYLKELGVGAVWLMPMMESTTYHGYDVVDYYEVEPDYGTMDDFKAMLKTLHDNDIKVIIDFVVNHTSSENEWFKTALTDNKSKYYKWYDIRSDISDIEDQTKYRQDKATGLYYYGLYDSIMPDLNYDNKEVREAVKDAAGFWLDAGVDGFRLDGANNVYADEPEKNVEWWSEFSRYVNQKNSSAFVVGENWYEKTDLMAQCYSSLYSSFDFPLCNEIEDVAGKKFKDFATDFSNEVALYKESAKSKDSASPLAIVSTMINNHDMDRIATRLDGLGTKLAANIQFTLPGTPFIYYGDELGQKGQSPDVNRREAFDWYKSATGTGMVDLLAATECKSGYTKPDDGISYEEESSNPDSMLARYKKLISIRNENKVMYTGEYKTIGATEGGMLAYTISGAKDKSVILVVHNTGDTDTQFTLKVDGKDLLNDSDIKAGDIITMAKKSSAIIKYTSDESPIAAEEFNYSVEELNKPKEEFSVKLTVTLPPNTPADEKIYCTGTFNEWNECDEDYVMERTSDTTCEITLKGEAQSDMEYKFTRGNWDKREQNANGDDLVGDEQKQNRIYFFEENNKELTLTIEKWSDIE